jgi:hypothetical protein
VTANPKLLDNKPEGKVGIKIQTDYNTDSAYDEVYANICDYFNDTNNVAKYLKK